MYLQSLGHKRMSEQYTQYYALSWKSLQVIVGHSVQSSELEKVHDLLNLNPIIIKWSDVLLVDMGIEKQDDTYHLVAFFSNKKYSFSNVSDLIANIINLITACFLSRTKQTVLHSGAIIIDQQAVLFSGLPHAGKSTLALSAWLANYSLINDDLLVYNTNNHTVSAFPKPLKPRLPTLDIPCQITKKAGASNLVAGHFVHDIGLFVGRKSQGMTTYSDETSVKAFYYIERGTQTSLMPLDRMQALAIALSQVMPNQSCLKISQLIHELATNQKIYHLIIGENQQDQALELMNA
jgi:hypothetical protein